MSQTHGGHQGLRYAPGLDGVRALAVFAVVAYHIGTTSASDILPGGYLGVDVFFVLSGYLITSLLVVEAQHTGRISIKNFYIRRARRLLPALLALLLGVAAVGALWLPQQAARLRGDLLASLGYVQNWWLIIQNSSYFGSIGDRPPMLTHLWSLAVEEQYYLIWPLVLIAFAAVRARPSVMLTIILAGVAASTAVGQLLYEPYGDPSRVYYGTDTRALAPLLGAALAIAIRPWQHRTHLSLARRTGLDLLGVAALLALVGISASLRDTDELLYRGGFLAIAALAAVVVAVAGHPDTGLGRTLGTQPLRYLGERSYAIYLWHWPVCLVTRPGTDIPITGWTNAALRIAIAIALAEISYQLIEKPIRRHGFLATLRRPQRPVPVLRTAALSLVLVAGGTAVGISLTSAAGRPAGGVNIDLPEPQAEPTVPPLPRGAKVAFFGDSQALSLVLRQPPNLSDYIEAVDASMLGCGILVGRIESRSGQRRDLNELCGDWRSIWRHNVESTQPQVAVIILGAWEVFDLTIVETGETLRFGTPEWDRNFRRSLAEAIAILRAPNRSVAVALVPCYRPIPEVEPFVEHGDDERTRHVNELLRAGAASFSGVYTVEPPEEFCTDPVIANDTEYRVDGLHYNDKGAALYFEKLLPQLRGPTG